MTKVSVRWEKPPKTKWPSLDHKMWVGRCAGCDTTTQYWSWGAALGHMLEHQWIGCEGDRRRSADRRRKYNRTEPEAARLSCGGRTHNIMGEEKYPIVPVVERLGGKVVYDERRA